MPTFDRQDKFSPDKAFSRVVWGERSKVLETELSEMQKILQHQTLALGEAILSNGFVDELPNITYENDELTIDPCAFVIDGFVYRVQSPLVLSQVQPESTVYIEVSEAEVSYQDTIRKDGNYTDGGEDLPDNGILDPDFGAETTRRVQWQIRLVTDDSDESKRYLPVCTVHGENAGVWEYEDLRQLCSLKSTYDVARKAEVDAVQTNLNNHANATTGVHGATSAATPNMLVQRDPAGRFKAGAPSAADDVARKAEVDAVDSAAMKKVADSDLNMNNNNITNINTINLRGQTDLTIDSNKSITVNRTIHRVNTSGGADELHAINGGNENDLLLLRIVTGANPVTIKHNVGNIQTPDAVDISLTNVRQHVLLIKASADWRVIATGVGLNRSGDAMRGPLSMGGYRITDLAAPTNANDVARKAEVDAHATRTDNPHGTTAEQVGAPSLTKTIPSGVSLSTVVTSGFYRLSGSHPDAPPSTGYGQMIVSRGGDTVFQIVTGFNSSNFYMRHGNPPEAGGAGVWQPWRLLWHDGNDGSGSGLDADLLDGQHASAFWTKSELGSDRTRKITISTSAPSGGADGDIWIQY